MFKVIQPKKKRSENWSNEEKATLRKLISQSISIIENKSTKTCVNLLKAQEWRKIMLKFNRITGKNRSTFEMKLAWKRMKLAAKAKLAANKKCKEDFEVEVDSLVPQYLIVEADDTNDDILNMMPDGTQTDEDHTASSSKMEEESMHEEYQESLMFTEKDIKPKRKRFNTRQVKIKSLKEDEYYSQNIDVMRESVEEIDIAIKKRQLQMWEIEHSYNVKIAQLKIKKLELEVAKLENNNDICK